MINEILLAATLAASATADGVTTRQSLARGGRETNPVARVFTGSVPTIAAFEAGTSLLTIYGSHRLKKAGSKKWWVPLAIGIGAHLVGTTMNRRVK